jgi:arginyl-tRNA synthetase
VVSGLEELLALRLTAAFAKVAGDDAAGDEVDPLLQRSARADFQANGALALGRRLGVAPRDLAARVLAEADLDDVAVGEISGPGFINLTVRDEALDRMVRAMAGDERLGVPLAEHPETVIVDYCGPNVAKEMHVGHLRSTIIGDALARILAWAGHEVKIISHIGDWGTPFGMLLERMIEVGEDQAAQELSVGDLDGYYKAARQRFDEDPAFADRSRQRVVLLQSGDAETLRLWHALVTESERYFLAVNDRLGVLLTASDFVGESFYNDALDHVASELDGLGLLRESRGADCVFPPGFIGRDGEPFPIIVRKRDSGYGYQATDLAAIRHRIQTMGGQRLLYVVGTPQSRHLEMVFAVARQAGWINSAVRAEHVAFGSILGDDGTMLRSRQGKSAKLIDLLDEAVARAGAVVAQKNPDLDADARARVAEAVGIGAIKYADLSTSMIKDYVFDMDRMLSFNGDTSVYLQFTHARIASILRKASQPASTHIDILDRAERALAVQLLLLPDVIHSVAAGLEVHRLTAYLRSLAVAFTAFVETCPVLRSPDAIRESRLALCALTARVLARGLDLLGIAAPERM